MNLTFTKEEILENMREYLTSEDSFSHELLSTATAALNDKKTLFIQKPEWDKALVYFMTARFLRNKGFGPIIMFSASPTRMNSQLRKIAAYDLNTVLLYASNIKDWQSIVDAFSQTDLFILAPSWLENTERLQQILALNPSMVIIDEAQSISEFSHDFRSEYPFIGTFLQAHPFPVLAVSNPVSKEAAMDINHQLGGNLKVYAGDLARPNISIQIMPELTKAERLASIAKFLMTPPYDHAQGLIFCSMAKDCDITASILQSLGIAAESIYPRDNTRNKGEKDDLKKRKTKFEKGEIRILVCPFTSTIEYNHPNVQFVIHMQRPGSLAEYYQHISRIGNRHQNAAALLFPGGEDAQLQHNMLIDLCQAELMGIIYRACAQPKIKNHLLTEANCSLTQFNQIINYLILHEYLIKEKSERSRSVLYRINESKQLDQNTLMLHQNQLTAYWQMQHQQVNNFALSPHCSMSSLLSALDGKEHQPCGSCANCNQQYLSNPANDPVLLQSIKEASRSFSGIILPRQLDEFSRRTLQPFSPGFVLYQDQFSEAGQGVIEWKYQIGRCADKPTIRRCHLKLVSVAGNFIADQLSKNGEKIDMIVNIPTAGYSAVPADFASRLAQGFHVQFIPNVLIRKISNPDRRQKDFKNSKFQAWNVRESIGLNSDPDLNIAQRLKGKTILLVDDLVDTRWTFAVCADLLLKAGAAKVIPFALVQTDID